VKVLILHNAVADAALPDDADVLMQVEAVGGALDGLGHGSTVLACDLDLAEAARQVRAAAPDLVFNLVESLGGYGRLVHVAPALLEAMGVPFTGSSAEAIFVTSCKPLAKRILSAAGLPTPAWVTLASGGDELPARMIVKSVWEHASRGLDDDAVIAAGSLGQVRGEIAQRAGSMGGEAFAEAYIEGREFNVSVLEAAQGPRVLPIAEMCFEGYAPGRPRVLGYAAKWDDASPESRSTVRRFEAGAQDGPLRKELARLSLRCWELFELRGYARVDFRVDEEGQPWILEVNANPCLSPDAGFAAAVAQADLSSEQAIECIVRAAARSVRT
jgi:D-alanine-D-alanine ligase